MRHLRILLFSIVLLSGGGLLRQQNVNIDVDSLTSATAKEKNSYILFPGNKGVTSDDLQFQEYARYLKHALKTQGFMPAKKAEEADVAIELAYGIGNPQTHQYSSAQPIWRSGPGNSDSWISGRFASQFRSQSRIQEQEHDQENETESLREFQGESGVGSVTWG